MAARVTEVRDAAVGRVGDWWAPVAPDEVVGLSRVDIDSATLTGRKVYVFRSAYARAPATRGEDQGDYTLQVMVVERYADPGDPTEPWVDERVDFCDQLVEVLGDARGGRLLADPGDPTSGLWPETAEVAEVHDIEELAERKLFVSIMTVMYRETRSA